MKTVGISEYEVPEDWPLTASFQSSSNVLSPAEKIPAGSLFV
jgi:hypothetical protein